MKRREEQEEKRRKRKREEAKPRGESSRGKGGELLLLWVCICCTPKFALVFFHKKSQFQTLPDFSDWLKNRSDRLFSSVR